MGNAASGFMYTLGFFAKTLKGIHFFLSNKASHKTLIMQILFTFVDAMGITCLLAVGIGAAVNIIGMQFLSKVGMTNLIYPLLITIITRELGPLLTAFIIIARSATAIATEIASMVISHEVEAYIDIGIDPIEHIVIPRFLGVTISMFLLNIYFSIFGLTGSFLISQLFNAMPPSIYFSNLLQDLSMYDILISVIKSIIFGMIISIMAVMQGFAVERARTEVPVAGLKAVSSCFAWCILADILLSALYYTAMG
jgi:phospholipid/cholesterol/gamma-HCH transport system permease protein